MKELSERIKERELRKKMSFNEIGNEAEVMKAQKAKETKAKKEPVTDPANTQEPTKDPASDAGTGTDAGTEPPVSGWDKK